MLHCTTHTHHPPTQMGPSVTLGNKTVASLRTGFLSQKHNLTACLGFKTSALANSQARRGFLKELSLQSSQLLSSLLINNNCLFKKLVCGLRWRAPARGESYGLPLWSLPKAPFSTQFGSKDTPWLRSSSPENLRECRAPGHPRHPRNPGTGHAQRAWGRCRHWL